VGSAEDSERTVGLVLAGGGARGAYEMGATLRSCDLAVLDRAIAGGADPAHGELLSYLFFAPELAEELMRLGRADACRWLAEPHHDGPWETGPLHVARAD